MVASGLWIFWSQVVAKRSKTQCDWALKDDVAGLEARLATLNTCNTELMDQVKALTTSKDIQPQPVNIAALLPNKLHFAKPNPYITVLWLK